MPLGQRIRDQRTARNLSQEVVGNACGISRAAVAQWESGETAPTMDKIEPLALCLVTSGEWLLTGQGQIADAVEIISAGDPVNIKSWLSMGRVLAGLSKLPSRTV